MNYFKTVCKIRMLALGGEEGKDFERRSDDRAAPWICLLYWGSFENVGVFTIIRLGHQM